MFENNPAGGHFNVSLWTLRHEVLCYFVILIVVVIAGRSRVPVVAIMAFGLALLAYPPWAAAVTQQIAAVQKQVPVRIDVAYLFTQGLDVYALFFMGAAFYFLRNYIPLNPVGVVVAICAMIGALQAQVVFPIFPFALGYVVIYFFSATTDS